MDILELLKTTENPDPFSRHNGVRVEDVKDGFCRASVTLTENSLNPAGSAHGGLIFSLCDFTAGVAAVASGRTVVTMSASLNFLRPGKGKILYCESSLVRAGKTVGVYESRVFDGEGELIAKGDLTVYYTQQGVSLTL